MGNILPEISIVIPVYNGERFIGECLESLVRQSYSSFECIVVDDGSTDRTADIVYNTGDSRFRMIEGTHRGSSVARNRGFLDATGEYVLFLDADDIFHANLLSNLHETNESRQADIVICNYRKYDTVHGTYTDGILNITGHLDKVFNAYDIPESILNIFSGVPWNKLYRKSFLEEMGIKFLENLVIGADSVFVHETLLTSERICYLEEVLIDYRVNNPASDVARAKNYLTDISQTVDELYDFLSKKEDYLLFLRSFDNWAMGKCLWIYSLNNNQADTTLVDLIRKYGLNLRPDDYYDQVYARDLLLNLSS